MLSAAKERSRKVSRALNGKTVSDRGGSVVVGLRAVRALAIATIVAVLFLGVSRIPQGRDRLLWLAEKGRTTDTCAVALVCLGVFDPSKAMASQGGISIDHVFVEWQAEPGRIQSAAREASERGRTLMITIEPWPWWRWEPPAPNRSSLLKDIAAGRYDAELKVMCSEVASVGELVYVRWGHEMEGRTGRYPWAGGDPAAYISAYRYFVDGCRRIAPKALFVWSPMGDRGLELYYPGTEHVDYVGLSLYASEKVERTQFGRTRSGGEMLGERCARVTHYGKPIFLAEVGVAGSVEYMENWFRDLGGTLRSRFPLVSGMIYFNEGEPHQLPEPFDAPDWRLGAKYFSHIKY